MKKPEIKYVGWCHECKCLGSFICGNCKPNEKFSFGGILIAVSATRR
jgi:hypothetical protein|nr:MAG TPA: Metallothionein Cu(I) metallothionein, Cu(I) metallothionein.44A [Caudoviricetes sp.]